MLFASRALRVINSQLLLVDLADRGQRQLGDEGHVLGDRDLGDEAALDVGGDVQADVVLADLAGMVGLEDDQRQRSFAPLHVLDRE